jgi:hypothetical protein
MDKLSNSIDTESCILSQTDSSSAAGWLKKSNFNDNANDTVKMTTARHLARLMIEAHSCLYSQWFAGEENVVADCLSRDFHLSEFQLTQLINSCVSHQVPFGL